MISSIRTWMFNKSLRGHSNYHINKDFTGVNLCNSICIIASGDSTSSNAVEKYKHRLESHGKRVEVLYFSDDKNVSTIGYSRQHVKWHGIPQHEIIDSILSKEYDLLIFLYPEMENHLRYLSILCNAKFKLGPGFQNCTHIFDLMIDISDRSNTELLIQSIDRQLKLLSS
ncbi:MAG: hypothetical protein P1U56_21530 [Saprospiraceae bacterium]|nr:hypothetical protein [Saprospiraceae bacterium]